ncbi:MAG: phosphopantothenoylcysteine synthase [Methanobacteriaceae archaeon]|jgi:phosphopantothenoylcysteine decarboxylase/phosphopantothenate--cysteine ligase|nr:phosphopantothenoylcysteine synthase [Methanobacteriaceae archaeon]
MSDIISKNSYFKKIAGKNILISLGGTYESIDPVRGISNKSSGKMGLELAKEAYIRGANLTLVVANVSVKIPSIFTVIKVESSSEMNKAILDIVSDFDIFISTAAVSDFSPNDANNFKISSSNELSIAFKPTVKIIKEIKKLNREIFLVGFKAEYDISENQMIDCCKKQIEMAGTDLVIANDLCHEGCDFGSDNNEVLLIDEDIEKINLSSKQEIAKIIFDKISKKL